MKAEERCCTEFREELRLRDSEGHGGVDRSAGTYSQEWQSRLDTKTSVTWLVRGWKGCAAQLAEECEMC